MQRERSISPYTPYRKPSDVYESRIRHLEDVVHLLLARTKFQRLPPESTVPLAGSFRYSIDRGLIPLLSKTTTESLTSDWPNVKLNTKESLIRLNHGPTPSFNCQSSITSSGPRFSDKSSPTLQQDNSPLQSHPPNSTVCFASPKKSSTSDSPTELITSDPTLIHVTHLDRPTTARSTLQSLPRTDLKESSGAPTTRRQSSLSFGRSIDSKSRSNSFSAVKVTSTPSPSPVICSSPRKNSDNQHSHVKPDMLLATAATPNSIIDDDLGSLATCPDRLVISTPDLMTCGLRPFSPASVVSDSSSSPTDSPSSRRQRKGPPSRFCSLDRSPLHGRTESSAADPSAICSPPSEIGYHTTPTVTPDLSSRPISAVDSLAMTALNSSPNKASTDQITEIPPSCTQVSTIAIVDTLSKHSAPSPVHLTLPLDIQSDHPQLAPEPPCETLEYYDDEGNCFTLPNMNDTEKRKKKKKKKKKKKRTTASGSNPSLPSPPVDVQTATVGALSIMTEEELDALERKNDPRYRPIEDS
ncbi:hypothetical protein PSTG_17764, partial [Puccinia striiformis f. sp. tritici PST-78]